VGQRWDKVGTSETAGRKSFFENREKSMKINRKAFHINYLQFSRECEKRVKISHTFFPQKIAGQTIKPGLNLLFSITSVSHKMCGTRLGQQRDNGNGE